MPGTSTDSATATPISFDDAVAAINARSGWNVTFLAQGRIRTANRPSVTGSQLRLLNLRAADGTGPILTLAWSTSLTKNRITMTSVDEDGGVEIRWPNGTWLKITKPAA